MIATPAPARARAQATDDWLTSSAIRCETPAFLKASSTTRPSGSVLRNEISQINLRCIELIALLG